MLQKLIIELTYEVSVPIYFNSLKENTVVCQYPIAKA